MARPSIIIPTRNRADILPETLRALARQSFPLPELEVVVVDDGSTDDTEARLRSTQFPFRLVYERLEAREGFCPARPRNRGLQAARGEIAIFLDADVLAGPDLVAQHVAAHAGEKPPRAVIGYTYGYLTQPEERTPQALRPPPPDCLLDQLPRLLEQDSAHWMDGRESTYRETNDLADHTAPWQLFWTCNASVPCRLALAIGGFDEEFVGWGGEDVEFAYRLFRKGVEFTLARRACGVHYPHPIPDVEVRRAEGQRNRRRLIAKHPEPELELQLWSPEIYTETWAELRAVLTPPPLLPPESLPGVEALLERLQPEFLAPGPFLLCGAVPPELVARIEPAAWCRPLEPSAASHAGPRSVPLLGVFTPWNDAAFAVAFIAEYWRRIPLCVLAGLVSEMLRVARCAVFLGADAVGDPSPLPLRNLERCASILQWLAPGCSCEVVREADLVAFALERKEPY